MCTGTLVHHEQTVRLSLALTSAHAPFSATCFFTAACRRSAASAQELTFVHFSAQLECFVWDRGCT